MLFDLNPKRRREDLFDFDEELAKLLRLIQERERLIVISGFKRTGKTSLVLTSLHSADIPYVYMNGEIFATKKSISKREFAKMFEDSANDLILNRGKWHDKLEEFLSGLSGISIEKRNGVPFIKFDPKWSTPILICCIVEKFGELAEEVEGKPFVWVFDEAQEFRKLHGYSLKGIFAHLYDHARNVVLIFIGSQKGFLYRFLGLNNPSSPLFPRPRVEIETRKLTPEESLEFLRKGFDQLGWMPDEEILKEVVEKTGGFIGWLTYVGCKAKQYGRLDKEVFKKILDEAVKQASRELEIILDNLAYYD